MPWRHSFNQPVCAKCWDKIGYGLDPVTEIGGEDEICAMCGKETSAGIVARLDPVTVRHPRLEKT